MLHSVLSVLGLLFVQYLALVQGLKMIQNLFMFLSGLVFVCCGVLLYGDLQTPREDLPKASRTTYVEVFGYLVISFAFAAFGWFGCAAAWVVASFQILAGHRPGEVSQ